MSKRPNILIISFLVVGIFLTMGAQFGFIADSDAKATAFGVVGIVLVVSAIAMMYWPIKEDK